MPEIIYCSGGNPRFAGLAIEAGMRYGARLPDTCYYPLYFADQDWRKPDRTRYMAALAKHQPYMATVLDWEREEQLPEVLDWAAEAATHVRVVVVVPKVHGGIAQLPKGIAGAEIRLGYSVPSKYGASSLMLTEYCGWPVHLLGGNPWRQMELARYLDVRSVDGNAAQGAALRWCMVWTERRWERLRDMELEYRIVDAPYEAFRRSCVNIMAAWMGWEL